MLLVFLFLFVLCDIRGGTQGHARQMTSSHKTAQKAYKEVSIKAAFDQCTIYKSMCPSPQIHKPVMGAQVERGAF